MTDSCRIRLHTYFTNLHSEGGAYQTSTFPNFQSETLLLLLIFPCRDHQPTSNFLKIKNHIFLTTLLVRFFSIDTWTCYASACMHLDYIYNFPKFFPIQNCPYSAKLYSNHNSKKNLNPYITKWSKAINSKIVANKMCFFYQKVSILLLPPNSHSPTKKNLVC